jgi:hypothetical protein
MFTQLSLAKARTPEQPSSAYLHSMLGRLQDTRGEPRLRVRVLAALVILGLLLLTAPLILVPVIDWLTNQL